MSPPTILGKAETEILAEMGVALLQVKNERRLTLEDIGAVMRRSREMVAQYIAGEAEPGAVAWRRAEAAWPELSNKLNGGTA
jgi:hypothetical protein